MFILKYRYTLQLRPTQDEAISSSGSGERSSLGASGLKPLAVRKYSMTPCLPEVLAPYLLSLRVFVADI
jgi:hypothetical protein